MVVKANAQELTSINCDRSTPGSQKYSAGQLVKSIEPLKVKMRSYVSQIIFDCFLAKRTGILTIKNDLTSIGIHFNEGNIAWANSNQPKDQFSEFLLDNHLLNQQNLQAVNNYMQQHQSSFGKTLIKLGLMTGERLQSIINNFVERIIWSTFTWQSPIYFFQDRVLPNCEYKIDKATIQIFFEGIKGIDHLTFIKQMIGRLDLPLSINTTLNQSYQALILQPQEAFILSRFDRACYTIREVIEMGSVSELQTLQTVCALLQIGLLQPAVKPQTDSLISDIRKNNYNFFDTKAVVDFCYDIEIKMRGINAGITIYELLEMDFEATPEQMRHSCDRLTKNFHPQRQIFLNEYHLDLQAELEFIFNVLIQAREKIPNFENPKKKLINTERIIPSRSAMIFCYEIESKLNEIKTGATLYQILEVERGSAQSVINSAYERFTRQFNLNRQTELTIYGLDVKFQLQQINKAVELAFDTLSNPFKKQVYDNKIGMNLNTQSVPSPVAGGTTLPNYRDDNQKVTTRPCPITKVDSLKDIKIQPLPDTSPFSPTGASSFTKKPLAKLEISTNCRKLTNDNSIKNPLPVAPNKVRVHKQTVDTLYMQSMEFYAYGEYEKSITVLKKVIGISPDNGEYWAALARVYSKLDGNPALVEAAYQEAFRCDPKDAKYLLELGLILQKDGRFEKAKEIFEKVLAINPHHIAASRAIEGLQNSTRKSLIGNFGRIWAKFGFDDSAATRMKK